VYFCAFIAAQGSSKISAYLINGPHFLKDSQPITARLDRAFFDHKSAESCALFESRIGPGMVKLGAEPPGTLLFNQLDLP
jgi:hypothetical protein